MTLSAAASVTLYEPNGTNGVNVAPRTARVAINRGRRNGIDTVETGTCTVEFWNNDGDWDPFDVAGPYYATQLVPGALLAVFYNVPTFPTRDVFFGRVESFAPTYSADGRSVIRVEAVDCLAEFAGVSLGAWQPAQQPSGNRITAMLARPELGSFGYSTNVEAGATTIGAYPVEAGTSAFDYLQRIVQSEQGFLYAARDGTLTFKGRYSAAVANNLEFRGVNAGAAVSPKLAVPFQRLTARASMQDLYNQVVTQTGYGPVFVNEDSASIAAVNRVSTLTLTDLLTASTNQANDIGKLVLQRYADPGFRVTSVDALLNGLPAGTADACLSSDIGDLVRVRFVGPSAAAYDATLRVEGVIHDITPDAHRMTWMLSPNVVDLSGLFVLGTSSLGGPDVLGF